jgi:hypothetical protein
LVAHLLGCEVDGLGAGVDLESEVAAAFGPFVVLLGQDGADQSDDRGSAGKDADHVGADERAAQPGRLAEKG